MENTATKPMKVIVRCKECGWRILDKVTPTTGIIEVKCQRCGTVSKVDLSLRRMAKYRRELCALHQRKGKVTIE